MPSVHLPLTELGELLTDVSEVEVVGFPAHTADETVPLSRRHGGEHVVMTRWHECLNISAAAVRAGRGFGDHSASLNRPDTRVTHGSDSLAQALPSAC